MRTVTLANEILFSEVISLLAEGKSVVLKTKGNSMLPFIVGDEDSVVLSKAATLRKGDIVLAELNRGQFVMHRIIRLDGDLITLMGDGNLCDAEMCFRNQVYGRVDTIIKKKRQIDCHKKGERMKAGIWRWLMPVRRYLLAIYRRIM